MRSCWPRPAGRRLRRRPGVPPGRRRDARRRPRPGGRALPDGRAGVAGQPELQDRARARHAGGVARAPRAGARSSRRRISSRRRAASTGWPASTIPRTAWRRRRSPRSIRSSASGSKRPGRGRRSSSCAQRARAASAEPILNPASREPLNLRFTNASLRDILNFIASATGINITYDRDVTRPPATVQLDGVTLEQALKQILSVNQLSYKVLSERSILVFPDTPPKHTQYDEQVVRTFYVSHADVTELTQLLSSIIRLPGIPIQPAIQFNKTANTITVRGHELGRPDHRADHRAERQAARRDRLRRRDPRSRSDRGPSSYGLNLSEYALGGIFSPEVSPGATTTTAGTRRRRPARDRRRRRRPAARRRRRPACRRRRRST